MGKGVEKHPCWTCGFLKVSSSGSTIKCAHPDITVSESYKYGRPFTCRCTPNWCPKDPDRSYLGPAIAIPQEQREKEAREETRGGKRDGAGRKTNEERARIAREETARPETAQDSAVQTKPIELDRVKVEMERVKNETENEMKNEQTLDNSITEQMREKIAYASEQRKRLGSLVYRIDLSNRDKSLDRTDDMIATENRISETLMNLLDVYDGIQ